MKEYQWTFRLRVKEADPALRSKVDGYLKRLLFGTLTDIISRSGHSTWVLDLLDEEHDDESEDV